jgi:hypothetical protein
LQVDSGIKPVLCRRFLHLPESISRGVPAVRVTLVKAIAAPAGVRRLISEPAETVTAITGAIALKAAAGRANASPAHV